MRSTEQAVRSYYDAKGAYIAEGDEWLAAYHENRLSTAAGLLRDLGGSVYDFGCGSGELLERLTWFDHRAGCDLSAGQITIARERCDAALDVGGLDTFLRERGPFDVVVALNVLPYLTEQDEARFFAHARRIAGHVLVSHTNMLFDLVTFNRYTVDFYRQHCLPRLDGIDRHAAMDAFTRLLRHPDEPAPKVGLGGASERDVLPKRRVDPFTYHPEGVDVIAFRPLNCFPLPPLVLRSRPDWAMAQSRATMDGTFARIFCSQFQMLLRAR